MNKCCGWSSELTDGILQRITNLKTANIFHKTFSLKVTITRVVSEKRVLKGKKDGFIHYRFPLICLRSSLYLLEYDLNEILHFMLKCKNEKKNK
jgi:hypothetical protein